MTKVIVLISIEQNVSFIEGIIFIANRNNYTIYLSGKPMKRFLKLDDALHTMTTIILRKVNSNDISSMIESTNINKGNYSYCMEKSIASSYCSSISL